MTASPLVTFDFEGHTYSIPAAEEWSIDALEAYEDGKLATLLREILGDGWTVFKSVPRKVGDLTALFAEAEKALNAGN